MRHLFTSNSRQSSLLRSVVSTFLLMLVGLIIVDQAVEVFFDRIHHSAPPIISDPQTHVGLDQFWKMTTSGDHPIVFSGNSMMLIGLSPHQFDDEIKAISNAAVDITSVNTSHSGSTPLMMHDILKYIILPEHPQALLYAVDMYSLSEDTDPVTAYFTSPIYYALSRPTDQERSLLLWLARHSGLARFRNTIQDWFTSGKFNIPTFEADDRGYLAKGGTIKPQDASLIGQGVQFPHADPRQHAAIKDIAALCKQYGVPCIFVGMPMSPESYRRIAAQDDSTFQQELSLIATDTQIPVWNFNTPACRNVLDDTNFSDFNHLNISGAEKFSSMLAMFYLQQTHHVTSDSGVNVDCVEIIDHG